MATYIPTKFSGIYQICNLVSGKIYIGCSHNVPRRFLEHRTRLIKGVHENAHLQNAWNKYGESSFKFLTIEKCPVEELCLREDYWVVQLKATNRNYGYNIKLTDPNGKTVHSAETIEKIRRAHKGKKPSALCVQRRKEVQMSPEGRAKQIAAIKKVDWYKVRASKRKPVIDTVTGKVYNSLIEASVETKIPRNRLSKYLLGIRTNKTNLKYI